jgi:hypothetical protein
MRIAFFFKINESVATVTRAADALRRSMSSVQMKARSLGSPCSGVRKVRAEIQEANEDWIKRGR